MNEDIVLPLDALAEFARFVEAMNVEEERYAQGRFVERARGDPARRAPPRERPGVARREDPGGARAVRAGARRDRPLGRAATCARSRCSGAAARGVAARPRLPRDREALEQAHKEVRDRLIVLATHMHAGDGNVHVNIPVLSNDRPMLRRAEQVIDRVMAKVVALGGVVSGEHGIGVTKLKYLEPERIAELSRLPRARSTRRAS